MLMVRWSPLVCSWYTCFTNPVAEILVPLLCVRQEHASRPTPMVSHSLPVVSTVPFICDELLLNPSYLMKCCLIPLVQGVCEPSAVADGPAHFVTQDTLMAPVILTEPGLARPQVGSVIFGDGSTSRMLSIRCFKY